MRPRIRDDMAEDVLLWGLGYVRKIEGNARARRLPHASRRTPRALQKKAGKCLCFLFDRTATGILHFYEECPVLAMQYIMANAVGDKFMLSGQGGGLVETQKGAFVMPDEDAPHAARRIPWHQTNIEMATQDKRVVRAVLPDECFHRPLKHDGIHPRITHPCHTFRRLNPVAAG